MHKMSKDGQKAQASNYKTNESQEYNVQRVAYSHGRCIVNVKVSKRVNLKIFHQEKHVLTMCGDGC